MINFSNVQNTLSKQKINSLLVTNYTNISYLTGFRGLSPVEREAVVFASKDKITLITTRLYRKEATKLKSKFLEVKIASERNEYESFIKESLLRGSPAEAFSKVGFEAADLKYEEYKKFKKLASPNKFIPTKDLVENLRIIKTEEEIKNIKRAQIISQLAFTTLLKTIKPNQTELEISDKLTTIIKSLGAESLAFESIVASGPNSALPHYKTGKRRIKKGEVLLLDFGAKYQNYCADLSRTVFIGNAKAYQKKIYDLVFLAQQKTIVQIKNNIKAKLIHQKVEKIFEKEKLKDNFIHSLGHGIGLEVHEKPSLSGKSKDTLRGSMVFSIEPGLYFPWGGIRLEDLFTIKNGNCQILGSFSNFTEI